MDNILYYWAKFTKLTNFEKRGLFNQLVLGKVGFICETRIYRILTRLTFQTLRKKNYEAYKLTNDEKKVESILLDLELSASTCHNWYYSSLKSHPINPERSECNSCFIRDACINTIPRKVLEQIRSKYEYRLVSKRIFQTLVKVELFKEALNEKLSDGEVRRYLRRIVEKDYYRKNKELGSIELYISKVLSEQGLKAMTVLRWFYVLKNSSKLMKSAQKNEIMPEDIFDKSMLNLKNDIGGGIHAN